MLELRNVLNIKEYCENLRSKKLGKRIFNPPIIPKNWFGKCFWDVLFSHESVDLLSPFSPRRQHFPENIFEEGGRGCSPEGRGPPSTNQISLGTSVVLLLNIKLEYMRSEL